MVGHNVPESTINSSNTLKNIKKFFILILLAFFSLSLIIIKLINNSNLDKNHVYVMGKVIYKDFSSRGTTYRYEFYFLNKKYLAGTKTIGWHKEINDLIYRIIHLGRIGFIAIR